MGKKNTNSRKKNMKFLYVIAICVIVVPILLLGYIYFSTKENSGSPIIGSRYNNGLSTKIKNNDLKKLEKSLQLEGVEKVEVNLTSATLRINLDVNDDLKSKEVTDLLKDAYAKVDEVLPVDTYFTNQEDVKMYDLDIHAYNFIPKDSKEGWIYKELVKNASSKKTVIDTLSSPRNEDIANDLLNPSVEEDSKEN